VRALLTLLIVGFIVGQTMRGVELKLLWTETLMIVLAHYFTSRRFVQLSPTLREQLEAEGAIEADRNPLHLPRHSIRLLIIGGFVGLAVYLHRQGRLFEPQSIAILGTVGAYLFGVVVRWLRPLLFGEGRELPAWWVDTKALVTILVVAATVAIQLLGLAPQLPFAIGHLENVTMGVVLFYFGSR
jgi:hypothetical protein